VPSEGTEGVPTVHGTVTPLEGQTDEKQVGPTVWDLEIHSGRTENWCVAYAQLTNTTLSTDAGKVMEKCGLDTKWFTPKTIRGSVATHLVSLGNTQASVMERGDWLSAVVFQTYYCRATQHINYSELLAMGQQVKQKQQCLPAIHQDSDNTTERLKND
jgi:hypothetical protein